MPENQPLTIAHESADVLKYSTGARILLTLAEALAEQETVHISLTGGTMGIAVWDAVAHNALAPTVDWSRVHFWWSDERFLPAEDGDRNAQQAYEAFLEASDVPEENIHVMGDAQAYAGPEEAAAAYAELLSASAPAGEAAPVFSLTLLGMGPDGHLASLFPGKEEIHDERTTVVGVRDSPKPPPLRTSMTLPLINRSERVWFLVSGQDKAEAFARVRAQTGSAPDAQVLAQTPAAGARGSRQTLYLVTRDALEADAD